MPSDKITTIKKLTEFNVDYALELDLKLVTHMPKRIESFTQPHMHNVQSNIRNAIDEVGYLPIIATIHDDLIEDILFQFKEEGYYDIDRLDVANQLTKVFQTMCAIATLSN